GGVSPGPPASDADVHRPTPVRPRARSPPDRRGPQRLDQLRPPTVRRRRDHGGGLDPGAETGAGPEGSLRPGDAHRTRPPHRGTLGFLPPRGFHPRLSNRLRDRSPRFSARSTTPNEVEGTSKDRRRCANDIPRGPHQHGVSTVMLALRDAGMDRGEGARDMRKIRTLVVGVAALFRALLPATASAAQEDPVAGKEGVSAAAYEADRAVKGTVPGGLGCVAITGAQACFEAYGD